MPHFDQLDRLLLASAKGLEDPLLANGAKKLMEIALSAIDRLPLVSKVLGRNLVCENLLIILR